MNDNHGLALSADSSHRAHGLRAAGIPDGLHAAAGRLPTRISGPGQVSMPGSEEWQDVPPRLGDCLPTALDCLLTVDGLVGTSAAIPINTRPVLAGGQWLRRWQNSCR